MYMYNPTAKLPLNKFIFFILGATAAPSDGVQQGAGDEDSSDRPRQTRRLRLPASTAHVRVRLHGRVRHVSTLAGSYVFVA